MITVNVRIEDNGILAKLNRLRPSIRNRTAQKLMTITEGIKQRAIFYIYENSQYGTGNLASAINTKVNSIMGTAEVFVDLKQAPYAPPVEVGARPHEIPNNPFWGKKGRMHPGMQGKNFMLRAAIDARLIAPKEISEGIRLAVRDVGLRAG